MAASVKSKEFDGRKRKLNENMQYKNQNSGSSFFNNKQNTRVLKPSSVNNLVEMVKKHTVFLPQSELNYGEQVEGMNLKKFLQDNLIIHETAISHKEPTVAPTSHAIEKLVKPNTGKKNKIEELVTKQRKPKDKMVLKKSGTEETIKVVQKRKAQMDNDADDEQSIVVSHLEKSVENESILVNSNESEPHLGVSPINLVENSISVTELVHELRNPTEPKPNTPEEPKSFEIENDRSSPEKSSPTSMLSIENETNLGIINTSGKQETDKIVLTKFVQIRLEKLDLSKTMYYKASAEAEIVEEKPSVEYQPEAEIILENDEELDGEPSSNKVIRDNENYEDDDNEGFELNEDYEIIDESYGSEEEYVEGQEIKISEKSDVLSEAIKEISDPVEESHYETAEEYSQVVEEFPSSKVNEEPSDIVTKDATSDVMEEIEEMPNVEFTDATEDFEEKNQHYQNNDGYFDEYYEEGEEYYPEEEEIEEDEEAVIEKKETVKQDDLQVADVEVKEDNISDDEIQGPEQTVENEPEDSFEEEIRTPQGEHLSDEYNEEMDEEQECGVQEVITLDSDSESQHKTLEKSTLDEIRQLLPIDNNNELEVVVETSEAQDITENTQVPATPTNTALSINTEPPKSLIDSFSALDEDYVKTLTPTLTFHDEEQEEDNALQPLITSEELLENEILETGDKPLILEKLVKSMDENLGSKTENNEEVEGKSLCDLDSDLEEPISFLTDKTESAASPRQITYQQVLKALEASKAFNENLKAFEESPQVMVKHNKVEQDFQEFVDEEGGQVFVNRISEPAKGLKIFYPSSTFAYFNYTHLPYLKQQVFIEPQNRIEKFLEKLPCCDLISSLIIENGIQDVFQDLATETLENFLAFAWKVSSCHPDYQVVTKCVEFFKWANQELSQTWYPTVSNILEVLINLGATSKDNNCPFKNTVESTTKNLNLETQAYKELEESLPPYRLQLKPQKDTENLAVKNLGAMLDILSFTIDKSLERVDTLVLLVWLSMDPLVRTSNLRNKIQKCVAYAIEKSPELFFANFVTDLSKRLVGLCDCHENALCLVRGLPSGGRGRDLQKMVSFGIIQQLLGAPEISYSTENTINNLVQLLTEYRISPKMDCHFLHTVISLIEIFVGNDIVPSQKRSLNNLSAMLNKSISQISDNYLNPENGALKTQMTLFKSKWNIICHSICDEEKVCLKE